ncbi:MAG: hypothetical protein J5872_05200 [Lachnospiraceae bacterium]|nr:hypothetical protein [Lachnospiraceae bacterium]
MHRYLKSILIIITFSVLLTGCGKKQTTNTETTPTATVSFQEPTYTPTPFVTIAPVEKDVTARAESIVPDLSGSDDAIWSRVPEVLIGKKLQGSGEPIAAYQVYWDEWNLYVRLKVSDMTPEKADNITSGDYAVIYVNESNSHLWRYGVGDYFLTVARDGRVTYGTGCNTEVIKTATYETDEGYIIELLLPLISVVGKNDTRFGFDVCVADFSEGKLQSKWQWADTGGRTESTLEWCGTIVMKPDIRLDESGDTIDGIKGMYAKAHRLPELSVSDQDTDLFDITGSTEIKNTAYGKDGAKASFKALYDSKYLYLLVSVEDATNDTESGVFTRKDSVEIFLTADGEKPSEYRPGTDMHFRISRDGMLECGNGASAETVLFIVNGDEDGYTALISVKMPEGFKEATKLGLDVHVNDSFGSGMRDFILTWSDTSLLTNTDLQRIGTLNLR